MVIRLKDSRIETIDDTETKKLRLMKIENKDENASIELELPKALSDIFEIKEKLEVVIDKEEIKKGESSRLYGEGTVFKINHEKNLEIVGTLGGLRLVLTIGDPKPSEIKTFDSHKFYIAIG